MRRLAVVLGGLLSGLAMALGTATPASAFAHDRVHNPYLHTVLDALSLAVATSPLWTGYLWGGQRRGLLMALVAVIQVPVGVIAFVPVLNPVAHAVALLVALALTAFSLGCVRRSASSPAPGPGHAPEPI